MIRSRAVAGLDPAQAVTVLVTLAAPLTVYLALTQRAWGALAMVAVVVVPVAAATRPDLLILATLPLSIVAMGLVQPRVAIVFAGVSMLLAVAIELVRGSRTLVPAHVVAALLAGVIAVSALYPTSHTPAPYVVANPVGLVIGLALLAATITLPPPATAAAAVTALSGAVVSVLLLAKGDSFGGRLIGDGVNSNGLAALVALPLIAALGLAWQRRRVWWLIPAVPCALAIAHTGSRGAILAVCAGVLVIAIGQTGRWRLPLVVAAAAAVAAVQFTKLADWLLQPLLTGRDLNGMERSSEIRGELAVTAWQAATSHPLRGLGYGTFPSYAKAYSGLDVYYHTHNDYLRLAAEAGFPALALLCVLLWLALRPPRTGPLVVLRAVAVTGAVNLLFINALDNVRIAAALWVSLGILIAANRGKDRVPALKSERTTPKESRCAG